MLNHVTVVTTSTLNDICILHVTDHLLSDINLQADYL